MIIILNSGVERPICRKYPIELHAAFFAAVQSSMSFASSTAAQ